MQHLNANVLRLVSVLGPVSCRFYSFVRCIYIDVCLRNVNQYYRKKMLSMALKLMLSLLAGSDVLLTNILSIYYFQMYAYEHYKVLRWHFLRPKKLTDTVGEPKSVNTVATVLCLLISELRGRHSERQMASGLSHSPNISKCQVSYCH